MVKWILATVMAMASCWSFADFDVTQCDVIQLPNQMSDMESIFTTSSLWNGLPVTGSYHTIAFANNPDTDIIFPMNSFPGKTDRFAVKVTGRILILEKGLWTFSVCHDAGFICTIVGNGYSDSFMEKEWSPIRDVKTFDIPIAGIYTVKIIHWNGGGAAMLEFAVAKGYHSEFNSSLFHLVGDSSSGIACVDPIALFAVYEANGGTGTMEPQTFEDGKKQKLSKNLFKKDGYVFKGWAKTVERANAETVDYKDEAEIAVDADMTLYAVWANPALTLTAESADWSEGSITLRCEDSDTSGTAHEYTLSYYDEKTKDWIDVGDDRAIDVLADANGVAHLTDGFFAVRSDGILPVNYRVRDNKSGRFSAPCVTRTKYGIFVSPGGYAPEMNLIAYPSANPNYAETFGRLATNLGSFAKVHVMTGSNAIYGKLNDAFVDVANTIKSGDVCFLYFGTHGGLHQNSTSSVLALYNGYYEESQLANHIKLLNGVDAAHPNGNGVAIIGFVHACHSKAISDNDADQYCRDGSWCVNSVLTAHNSAWITATDSPKALSQGDYFSLFLLDYGWENGWAADSDGQLSCKALADYTKERTDAIFDGLTMKDAGVSFKVEVGVVGASSLLRNITIGRCGNHIGMSPPTDPEGITAQGISENAIRVQAGNLQRADRTIMFKRRGENATWESDYWTNWVGSFSYDDTDVWSSAKERPYYYQIRTMNGAGVGRSGIRSAWRIHTGGMTQNWLDAHRTFATTSNGDILSASEMTAANGCRTVGECYALGIDPEDANDDLKIAEFKMKDGKPEITLNHTKDGSGNSFEDRVKILGKAELTDAEWQEVPPEGNPTHRFFTVGVEMP